MDERFGHKLERLEAAVADFSAALALPLSGQSEITVDTLKNGQTRKFEFCVELLWKTIKEFLKEIHGYDEASPKKAVKRFSELGYCNYEAYERLLRFIDTRNELSHIYEKAMFERAYQIVLTAPDLLRSTLKAMEEEAQ